MFYEYKEVPVNISGVYRIIFPNGKSYIGISNDIKRRMKEHAGTDLKRCPDLAISRAIKKYKTENLKVEIIEEIDSQNRTLMREQEKIWIKHYNSMVGYNGYNTSTGGDGADSGEFNHEALLTSEQVNNVIQDLKDRRLTIIEIAEKYHVTYDVISRLNNGHTYIRNDVTYPIREKRLCNSGVKNKSSKFYDNPVLLEDIKKDLMYTKIPILQLSKKYKVGAGLIHNINSGKKYHDASLQYPLRTYDHITHKRIFTKNELDEIYALLKDKKVSMIKISNDFKCDRKVIADLNNGIRQPQEGIDYPIRKTFSKNKPVQTISESRE